MIWLLAGLTLTVSLSSQASTPASEDVAAVLQRQTQEMVEQIQPMAGLEGQQTGRKAEILKAEVADVLFVPGKPRYRKVFLRGANGRITGFAERREAWDLVWTRVP
jgi:hypothetical protein